ncbi:hypothetical protein P8C59_001596 [Phyllachora maydis]|uniref:ATP-dependent DNA ligase family profile domain-containing protein n=1 Tax=Phyllachora maydis TaxID=1825666 RepID=A0AAD9HZV1_9PEZI|nr:hypothetical protein P8C59_001596 [Phyllachora maydis]
MPFLYTEVCDLLQRLDENRRARTRQRPDAELVRNWFKAHEGAINSDGVDRAALLSTLLPEKRTDRVYNMQESSLQRHVGRALGLQKRRMHELVDHTVTVEEVDGLLHQVAAQVRFSSPAVKASATSVEKLKQESLLAGIFARLSARDAKWFTRLILKNYLPVVLDLHVVYNACHPLLPMVLRVQDDFTVACRFLQRYNRDRQFTAGPLDQRALARELQPVLGIKVGRQNWVKGRSIQHCLDMGHGRTACEDKIDGEYCQIHVDLRKPRDCIQIFSKSGKDSTQDRKGLHEAIRGSLRLGRPDCPVKTDCILEGELVVWSDEEKKMLDFHKIRKYVSRSGSFLGTGVDSQRHSCDHLMIVYYDALMIDGKSLLNVPQSQRFLRLQQLITHVEGRSAIVNREVIDLSRKAAASELCHIFARCIAARKEGLVLKPDEPYFNFGTSSRPYVSCVIKLKKEYIGGGFGDVGDFAVVGARYDAAKAKAYGIANLQWTHFYIACLKNKDDVLRWKRPPRFLVTNVVELNATQLKSFVTSIFPRAVEEGENGSITLDIKPGIDGGKRPSVIFLDPPVFDVRCFSFDKEGNMGFWTPRFPVVNRIHPGRTNHDVVSFVELQDMAANEKGHSAPEDSQEIQDLMTTLRRSVLNGQAEQSTQSSSHTNSVLTGSSSPRHSGMETQETPSTLPGTTTPPEPPTGPSGQITNASANGQLTPPTSAEVRPAQASQAARGDETPETPRATSSARKRTSPFAPADTPRSAKAARRSAHDATAQTPAASLPPTPAQPSPRRPRAPLSDIPARSPRPNSTRPRLPGVSSMLALPTAADQAEDAAGPGPAAPASDPGSALTQLTQPRPALRTSHSASALAPPRPPSAHQAGTCRHRPATCPLASYVILLAPCIAGVPWLTEYLLPAHGITEPCTDPAALAAAAPSRKKRKMLLVESRRREAMEAFLARVEAAELRTRKGEREWVPVYDWRVLEVVTAAEAGRGDEGGRLCARVEMGKAGSVWGKYWVGLT